MLDNLDTMTTDELGELALAIKAVLEKRLSVIANLPDLPLDIRWSAYCAGEHKHHGFIQHLFLTDGREIFTNEYDHQGIVSCYRHQKVTLDDVNETICQILDGNTCIDPDTLSEEELPEYRQRLVEEIQTILMAHDFGSMCYDW